MDGIEDSEQKAGICKLRSTRIFIRFVIQMIRVVEPFFATINTIRWFLMDLQVDLVVMDYT